jgi:hypothetical protein
MQCAGPVFNLRAAGRDKGSLAWGAKSADNPATLPMDWLAAASAIRESRSIGEPQVTQPVHPARCELLARIRPHKRDTGDTA